MSDLMALFLIVFVVTMWVIAGAVVTAILTRLGFLPRHDREKFLYVGEAVFWPLILIAAVCAALAYLALLIINAALRRRR